MILKFASNQTFQISGEYRDVETVLKFAMKASGHKKALNDKTDPTNIILQTTESGLFCVGVAIVGKRAKNVDPPKGWVKSPFNYDPKRLSHKISDFLMTQPPANNVDPEHVNGGVFNGFLCLSPSDLSQTVRNTIQSPEHCVVIFKPWRVHYQK